MALINCPECNAQISDKASNCPNCGFPIKEKGYLDLNQGKHLVLEQKRPTSSQKQEASIKQKYITNAILLVVAVVIAMVYFKITDNDGQSHQKNNTTETNSLASTSEKLQSTESNIAGTYRYKDASGTDYTLVLNADKTAAIKSNFSTSDVAKYTQEGKGSWYNCPYADPPQITVDIVDNGSLFIREGYIYNDMNRMKAKMDGFLITKD